jgi:hypothetical protein
VACVREGGGGSNDLGLGLIRAVCCGSDGWHRLYAREQRRAPVDRFCRPGPLVHDGPVTDREGVRDQGRWFRDLRRWSHARDRRRRSAGSRRRPTTASPEVRRRWRFRRHGAPFATQNGQGERGGRRGAHQGLDDGGGAVQTTCGDEGGRDHGRSPGR